MCLVLCEAMANSERLACDYRRRFDLSCGPSFDLSGYRDIFRPSLRYDDQNQHKLRLFAISYLSLKDYHGVDFVCGEVNCICGLGNANENETATVDHRRNHHEPGWAKAGMSGQKKAQMDTVDTRTWLHRRVPGSFGMWEPKDW
jgi:hypothetical protein